MSSRCCPYCNSAAVVGLGAFIDTRQTVNFGETIDSAPTMVELRCGDCGKLFVSEDRRTTASDQRSALEDWSAEDA